MKVQVKLYGTLSERFPDYQHSQGMEVEIPEGATVEDLLTRLEIPESQRTVVVVQGRILKADDVVQCGGLVSVFQAIGGG